MDNAFRPFAQAGGEMESNRLAKVKIVCGGIHYALPFERRTKLRWASHLPFGLTRCHGINPKIHTALFSRVNLLATAYEAHHYAPARHTLREIDKRLRFGHGF